MSFNIYYAARVKSLSKGIFSRAFFIKFFSMNKNIFISIGVAIFIIGGIILLSNFSSQSDDIANKTASSRGILTPNETTFDFGTISMAAGKVTHTYKIKNSSSEAVAINKIYTSCMCTSASIMNGSEKKGPFGMPGHTFIPSIDEEVKPSEEVTIEAVFDPAAHGPAGVGRVERVITLENNAGKPIELGFTANVRP